MIMTSTGPPYESSTSFPDHAYLQNRNSAPYEESRRLASSDKAATTPLQLQGSSLHGGEGRVEFSPYLLSKYQVSVPDAILHNLTRKSNKQQRPQELGEGVQPRTRDVVCGRGKGSYNRPGNVEFRRMVKLFVRDYLAARTKFEKTTVLNRIIDHVHQEHEARFLKFNSKTKQWFEITDDQAREKVGHTMRETISSLELTQHEEQKHHDLLHNQKAIFESMLRNNVSRSTGGVPPPSMPPSTRPPMLLSTSAPVESSPLIRSANHRRPHSSSSASAFFYHPHPADAYDYGMALPHQNWDDPIGLSHSEV